MWSRTYKETQSFWDFGISTEELFNTVRNCLFFVYQQNKKLSLQDNSNSGTDILQVESNRYIKYSDIHFYEYNLYGWKCIAIGSCDMLE
jgi:hypothetical protein